MRFGLSNLDVFTLATTHQRLITQDLVDYAKVSVGSTLVLPGYHPSALEKISEGRVSEILSAGTAPEQIAQNLEGAHIIYRLIFDNISNYDDVTSYLKEKIKLK